MRIPGSVFASSVLFTIALLCLIPAFSANVLTRRDKIALAALDVGYRAAARAMSDLAIACLAIILIGLIVTWTGYIKRAPWAWVVMSIVVWVWAFPLLALPIFEGKLTLSFSEWLYSAIHQPGSPRIWAESVLIFSLMVIALLLPAKFFLVRGSLEPTGRPSAKLIGGSAAAVLFVMIALLTWIHLRVYEIPLAELNSWQQLPVPPPPTPCKVQ